jgi:hypothetical protein
MSAALVGVTPERGEARKHGLLQDAPVSYEKNKHKVFSAFDLPKYAENVWGENVKTITCKASKMF